MKGTMELPEEPNEPNKAMLRRNINYSCDRCHRVCEKNNLVAVRWQFKDMGETGRVFRTRTVEWICRHPQGDGGPSCLDLDAVFNTESLGSSPGFRDTALAPDAIEAHVNKDIVDA